MYIYLYYQVCFYVFLDFGPVMPLSCSHKSQPNYAGILASILDIKAIPSIPFALIAGCVKRSSPRYTSTC